jgi:hypothetical protein
VSTALFGLAAAPVALFLACFQACACGEGCAGCAGCAGLAFAACAAVTALLTGPLLALATWVRELRLLTR